MNLRMCLNWKVLSALAAVGIGVVVVAPGLASAALPVLLLAACPLSMLVMALGMGRMDGARRNDASTPGLLYSCPMHPQVDSAAPGQCSACGMALVRAQAAGKDQLPALRAKLVALQADEAVLSHEIATLEQESNPRAATRAVVSEAKR